MKKTAIFSNFFLFMTAAAPADAQSFFPPKEVRLTCAPLPYVFDCSISLMPNPQFTSRCFYVSGEQSTLMRADHRMGFTNQIVALKVNAGVSVTGVVTESQSGKQARCVEEEE